VLERGRAGHTWRTQRWDSLRLNNPGWMNPMLGPQPRDTDLTLYGRHGSWLVRTAGGEVRARTVVIATGGENVPHTPDLARRLPERIAQCHAANYRAPAQLPGSGVLVVGSAQSGYQIAEELLAAGRRVVVATSAIGRAPAQHRGRATVEWLVDLGFFEQRPENLPAPDDAVAPADLHPPQALDLRADGIDSVVWCTGYTSDFTWLDPALTDAAGQPIRNGAAAAAPGLWYMGLRWLTRRGSGNFIGFPADAAAVAGAVATHLGGRNVRTLRRLAGPSRLRDRRGRAKHDYGGK
jgi:hypothetical protein